MPGDLHYDHTYIDPHIATDKDEIDEMAHDYEEAAAAHECGTKKSELNKASEECEKRETSIDNKLDADQKGRLYLIFDLILVFTLDSNSCQCIHYSCIRKIWCDQQCHRWFICTVDAGFKYLSRWNIY